MGPQGHYPNRVRGTGIAWIYRLGRGAAGSEGGSGGRAIAGRFGIGSGMPYRRSLGKPTLVLSLRMEYK